MVLMVNMDSDQYTKQANIIEMVNLDVLLYKV